VAVKTSSHWPITLTNGTTAMLMLFLPLGLVRILSPEQLGRYQIFFLYIGISPSLFMTGALNNGVYHWAGKYPGAKPEVRQSWTLLVLLTFLISMIGLTISKPLAFHLNIPPLDLRLFLLAAPFIIASTFLEDLMISRGNIWTGSFYSAGFNLLKVAGFLAAAWWTRKAEALFLFFLGFAVLRTAIGLYLLSQSDETRFLLSRERIRNVLRYSLPVSLSSLAGLGLQNVDKIILSMRLSVVSYASYALGCLSIPPLEILETSVNRVMIPGLSKAFASKKPAEAAALYSEGVAELFRILMPAAVGLMIYSEPIVRILFTTRYLAAATFLRWYALAYLFMSLPYDAVARARGDGHWILRTSILFALFCAPATWFAAGHWGALGALGAMLTSVGGMRLYSLSYSQRHLGLPLSKFLPLREMMFELALAGVAALISILLYPLFSDSRTWFLVTGPLFTIIYFGGVFNDQLRRFSSAPGPIHVLELSQTLCLGGLEKTVYTLSRRLNRDERFNVTVATYDHPDDLPSLIPQFEKDGIRLVQWQKGKGISLGSVFRLLKIIFSEKTRVLHVHDLGPLIYGSLAKLFSLGRVRLFLTVHTLLDIQQNFRYRLYYKFFLLFPDQIIAVSPGVKNGLLAIGVPHERIEVIPNGAIFTRSLAGTSGTEEKKTRRRQILPGLPEDLYACRWILCLARLHPGKGQDVVLDVWRALPENVRTGLSLFLVGQETKAGYMNSLQEKIKNLPDSRRVILVGPSEQPLDWIQLSDLFISGSRLEGMPLAPMEAAGSGLPTLLSEIEGHHYLKPWAHYFDPEKPNEGAKKIVEILETLKNNGETQFFENQWNASSSLREQWGSPAMTKSYAELFQTGVVR
jgi:O-antigen/teichoic acid export membrane protein/glycosyltransferase involved in cell wall biosynthesis